MINDSNNFMFLINDSISSFKASKKDHKTNNNKPKKTDPCRPMLSHFSPLPSPHQREQHLTCR